MKLTKHITGFTLQVFPHEYRRALKEQAEEMAASKAVREEEDKPEYDEDLINKDEIADKGVSLKSVRRNSLSSFVSFELKFFFLAHLSEAQDELLPSPCVRRLSVRRPSVR